MCGRFSRFTGQDIIEDYFSVDMSRTNLQKSYNIAPSESVGIVFAQDKIILDDMEWGFIPSWSETSKPKIKPINTRVDSLTKNMFKKSFEKLRCLVPTNGYYEWKKTNDGKIPFFIRPKNMELFAFAGIYSIWKKNGSEMFSFSILTTDAIEEISHIHNRMPVILDKEKGKTWLNPNSTIDNLTKLFHPYNNEIEYYPVSTYVNKPGNNSPKCIEKSSEMTENSPQRNIDDFF